MYVKSPRKKSFFGGKLCLTEPDFFGIGAATILVERFLVSRMRDFYLEQTVGVHLPLLQKVQMEKRELPATKIFQQMERICILLRNWELILFCIF